MELVKSILKYVVTFIVLIVIFFGSLTITSLIPSSALKKNVTKTSEVYKNEGEKRQVNILGKKDQIFIFTDALMVNTAYSIDSKHPITSFILARKNYIPGQTTQEHEDSQYNLGSSENYHDQYGNVFQAGELYGLMHGEKITDSYEYARYWHGYLVFLRPLLSLMSINGIRALNFIIIAACLVALFILIRQKCGFRAAILFILPLLFINVFVLSLGLSDVYDMIIAMLASITLLVLIDVQEGAGIYFFIFGCLTAFIDLLTIPLVTLCLPLYTFFICRHRLYGKYEEKELKQKILTELGTFVVLCYSWTMGYVLTWATKWIITEAFFNRKTISSALEQIRYRSADGKLPYGLTLKRNFDQLGVWPPSLTVLAISVDFGIRSYLGNKNGQNAFKTIRQNTKEKMVNIIPFVLTGILPFLWIFVVRQHSAIHSFFVNRIFVITIMGILLILYELYSTKNVEQKGRTG